LIAYFNAYSITISNMKF